MYVSSPSYVHIIVQGLRANMGSKIDWLRAAVDLLTTRCAVASGVVGLAVKDGATVTGREGVVNIGKWVAPFAA